MFLSSRETVDADAILSSWIDAGDDGYGITKIGLAVRLRRALGAALYTFGRAPNVTLMMYTWDVGGDDSDDEGWGGFSGGDSDDEDWGRGRGCVCMGHDEVPVFQGMSGTGTHRSRSIRDGSNRSRSSPVWPCSARQTGTSAEGRCDLLRKRPLAHVGGRCSLSGSF